MPRSTPSCFRPEGVNRYSRTGRPVSDTVGAAFTQPLSNSRCSAGYREPSSTLSSSAESAEIRRAIADGEAKSGERLPPAKDLAAVLGVNTNTVLRSLRLLRDEGLLEFRRGRGISVAGTPERGAVVQRARELVDFARQQGYRTDELIAIIEQVG